MTETVEAKHTPGHEFVAIDANDNVVASQIVMLGRTLEAFAAHWPDHDVAEVINDREVRTIAKAGSR